MLAHTTRALQLVFQTIAEVDTLDELARVGTIAVELYEADDAVLRELMDAIETRATAIREQLRFFPAPPVEVQTDVDLEPAPGTRSGMVRASADDGPDELNAIEELTHKHWERASLTDLRWAIQRRRRDLRAVRRTWLGSPTLRPPDGVDPRDKRERRKEHKEQDRARRAVCLLFERPDLSHRDRGALPLRDAAVGHPRVAAAVGGIDEASDHAVRSNGRALERDASGALVGRQAQGACVGARVGRSHGTLLPGVAARD
jgi:hypothetical protein